MPSPSDEHSSEPRAGWKDLLNVKASATLSRAALPPNLLPARRVPVPATARTVVDCYDFLDRVFPACGLDDLTEGIYGGDPQVDYEQAQRNQHNYLLDQAGCGPGSRLLDIGCGNGSLLARAQQRGAHATGITISPRQVARCRDRALEAHLLDYRNLGDDWWHQFDAIIANGSVEHFVQPAETAAGRADEIYAEMFALCHRLLDPASSRRRFVTTTIHFDWFVSDPRDLMRSPFAFPWRSDHFHAALLERAFGGFYPVAGQLERCARPFFELVREKDGTEDYRLTSEVWLARIRRGMFSFRPGLRMWADLAPYLVRHPGRGLLSLWLVHTQSWQWQFRGPHPPMRLLRQTWQARRLGSAPATT